MLKRVNDRALLEQRDEELIALIQKGSITAVERLYGVYKGLIYNISITFLKENGLAQMYLDDLVDIATDALLRCSQKYVICEDNSFLNYWWSVTNNQFASFLRKTINTGVVYFDPYLVEASEICLLDSNKSFSQTALGRGVKYDVQFFKSSYTSKISKMCEDQQ